MGDVAPSTAYGNYPSNAAPSTDNGNVVRLGMKRLPVKLLILLPGVTLRTLLLLLLKGNNNYDSHKAVLKGKSIYGEVRS